MAFDEMLRDPERRGVRRWALELLRGVRETRDRLDDASDADALHDFRVALRRLRSWLRAFRPLLRDTLSGKTERRLKRIADATGASRDLAVHIEWIEHARSSMRGGSRYGATWLLERFRAGRAIRDGELRAVINDEYDRATKRVENALQYYHAPVLEPEGPFAHAMAGALGQHAANFGSAVKRVSGQGDRDEAHAARIASKRLRYVLEPLAPASADAHDVVEELKLVQDTLGELHDAQLFGSEIAAVRAELIADRWTEPVAGLELLSRRLRRSERAAFKAFSSAWHEDAVAALVGRVDAIADSTEHAGDSGVGMHVHLVREDSTSGDSRRGLAGGAGS